MLRVRFGGGIATYKVVSLTINQRIDMNAMTSLRFKGVNLARFDRMDSRGQPSTTATPLVDQTQLVLFGISDTNQVFVFDGHHFGDHTTTPYLFPPNVNRIEMIRRVRLKSCTFLNLQWKEWPKSFRRGPAPLSYWVTSDL